MTKRKNQNLVDTVGDLRRLVAELQVQRDALLAACKAVLAWATRECMPQGGKSDGPWELVEAAVSQAEDR